jgi:hypothetical protein
VPLGYRKVLFSLRGKHRQITGATNLEGIDNLLFENVAYARIIVSINGIWRSYSIKAWQEWLLAGGRKGKTNKLKIS